VESYRNCDGRVCHKTIIQVGFMPDVAPEQMNIIQKQLTLRAEGKIYLFEESDRTSMKYINVLWQRMIAEKRIDLPDHLAELNINKQHTKSICNKRE